MSFLRFYYVALFFIVSLTAAKTCTPSTFKNPELSGVSFISIEATIVQNYSTSYTEGVNPNQGAKTIHNARFCNVTVSYIHPGKGDNVQVQIWLPLTKYNNRMIAIGGAGFEAGWTLQTFFGMAGAVDEGSAGLTTNAGIHSPAVTDWGLLSPGKANLYILQNLGYRTLNEASVIGKSIIKDYYGSRPKYSYWSGCSQGGRQGLMLAQRYPGAFDGIAAAAPALGNWGVAPYYPDFVMDQLKVHPTACEMAFIRSAALSACDAIDGVKDSIISDPALCHFDGSKLVGRTTNCDGPDGPLKVSAGAVKVAESVWFGAKDSSGKQLYPAQGYDAVLSGGSLTDTACTNGTCVNNPNIFGDWIRLFVLKDAKADLTKLSRKDFEDIYHASAREYDAVLATVNPDLRRFQESGGKIITYHGLADQLLPYNASTNYYDQVRKQSPNVQDYYRLFLAPGVSHCYGGAGPFPNGTFAALRNWVEKDVAPEILDAYSVESSVDKFHRPLCLYPKKQYYRAGRDPAAFNSFYCK